MILHIPGVLTPAEAARFRERLEAAAWVDGKETAGPQSALVKRNRQLAVSAPEAAALGGEVLDRLGRHQGFIAAALPARVVPPLFNRYEAGMGFGDHIDNAIRFDVSGGRRYRTDLSATLFLSNPADYDGGELMVEDGLGHRAVKLPAGDLALYAATTVHHVTPVTRGVRLASFFWVQSLVRAPDQRQVLRELDQGVVEIRAALGDDHPSVIRLTGVYHNLLRQWAEG
jgi:PKHD-type hydroxylase